MPHTDARPSSTVVARTSPSYRSRITPAPSLSTVYTFSKVTSRLNLLYKITIKPTFENFHDIQTHHSAPSNHTRAVVIRHSYHKFSKVSSLRNLPSIMTIEPIFENFHQRRSIIAQLDHSWDSHLFLISHVSHLIFLISHVSHLLSFSSHVSHMFLISSFSSQVSHLMKFSKVSSLCNWLDKMTTEPTFGKFFSQTHQSAAESLTKILKNELFPEFIWCSKLSNSCDVDYVDYIRRLGSRLFQTHHHFCKHIITGASERSRITPAPS